MDDQDYDPLLGPGTECPAVNQPKLASAGSRQRTRKKAVAPTPPPENAAIPNAAVAANLREVAAAGFMHWIMNSSMSITLDAEAFALFRDKLLEDAGAPTDPIEVMLIEQLALAHFTIGRMHIKACSMDNAKLCVAFTDAATRLLGEFRRCSIALEDFRAKQAARKERSTSDNVAEKEAPAAQNGKAQPSTNGNGSSNGESSANGKKMAPDRKLTTNGKEIPECIRQRMGLATNDALTPTVAIAGNGED